MVIPPTFLPQSIPASQFSVFPWPFLHRLSLLMGLHYHFPILHSLALTRGVIYPTSAFFWYIFPSSGQTFFFLALVLQV